MTVNEPRTKDTALSTLLSLSKEGAHEIQDRQIAALLTEDLLRAVFNGAWRLQYDDDIVPFQQAVRDLVVDVADAADRGHQK
jgi:hypothetical protein